MGQWHNPDVVACAPRCIMQCSRCLFMFCDGVPQVSRQKQSNVVGVPSAPQTPWALWIACRHEKKEGAHPCYRVRGGIDSRLCPAPRPNESQPFASAPLRVGRRAVRPGRRTHPHTTHPPPRKHKLSHWFDASYACNKLGSDKAEIIDSLPRLRH